MTMTTPIHAIHYSVLLVDATPKVRPIVNFAPQCVLYADDNFGTANISLTFESYLAMQAWLAAAAVALHDAQAEDATHDPDRGPTPEHAIRHAIPALSAIANDLDAYDATPDDYDDIMPGRYGLLAVIRDLTAAVSR